MARLEELVVVSRDDDRAREPVTIEALADAPLILYDAQYGADDPMRRQLVDRAQRAGVTLRPVIEVEGIEAAVGLARRGLGDTIVPRAAISRQGVRGLHFASFAEPLYDTFAFIARTRRSALTGCPRLRRDRRAAARARGRSGPVRRGHVRDG